MPEVVLREEYTRPSSPPTDAELQGCGVMLRSYHQIWRSMVHHLRSSDGAVSTELSVILDPDGRALNLCLTRKQVAAAVAVATQHLVVACCIEHQHASMLAEKVVMRVASTNASTIRPVLGNVTSDPNLVVTVRVSIKPVSQLRCNVKLGDVWFANTHANICVIDTLSKTMVVFEPEGADLLPGSTEAVAAALLGPVRDQYLVLTNHGMGPVAAVVPRLVNHCTVTCAVAALTLLANPVPDEASCSRIVHWLYKNAEFLLKLFMRMYRHARALSMTGIP